MRHLFWIALAACGSSPGAPDAALSPDAEAPDAGPVDPAVGAALTNLELLDGWTDPRALAGDVNTTGWEDSSFIAPRGRRLYFGYTRWDHDVLIDQMQIELTGPERDGQHGGSFDIYEAALDGTGWHVTNSSVNDDIDVPEAAQGVDRDERTMVFVRFEGDGDLYQSTRASIADAWDTPARLPAPLSTDCVEDNVHITADGAWLFFDSDRADATGTSCKAAGMPRDLYMAARDGDGWAAPTLVPGDANAGLTRFQPFATAGGARLYWTGANAADCATTFACVYRADRNGDGDYVDPVLVARVTEPRADAAAGDVIAIGEVSMTEDGRWLYFTYMQKVDDDTTDLSIGVARAADSSP